MTRRFGVYGRKYNRAYAGDNSMPRSKHEARFGGDGEGPYPIPVPNQDPNQAPDNVTALKILLLLGYKLEMGSNKYRIHLFQQHYNMMIKCGMLKHIEPIVADGIIGKHTIKAIKHAYSFDQKMPKTWMYYVKKCHVMLSNS